MIIPLFRSHYSSKSILTLDEGANETGPSSIVEIAKKHNLKKVFLIEDCPSGLVEANKNLSKINSQLVFGLRLTCTKDTVDKSEDSFKFEHKVILIARNKAGLQQLIQIWNCASIQGFYYRPRIDYSNIEKIGLDNIQVCIPFYDSYLFNNHLLGHEIINPFTEKDILYFLEDNCLPFDNFMRDKVLKKAINTQEVQSVYYEYKKDFEAYLTYRCILNRSTLDCPELSHMTSNEFCFERYLEKAKQ